MLGRYFLSTEGSWVYNSGLFEFSQQVVFEVLKPMREPEYFRLNKHNTMTRQFFTDCGPVIYTRPNLNHVGRPFNQVVVELPDLTSVQDDVWKERDTYFGHQSQK